MAFDDSMDDAAVPFDPEEPLEGEAETEPEAEAPPEELTLEGLDDETRARVEAYYAQQEQRREDERLANLREYGLDLNREGKPLIADPAKFAGWAAPAAAPRERPTAAPVQAAVAAAPEEEAPPEFDPLTATAEEYRRLADWTARQAMKPLLEENRRLLGIIQRQSASEAVQSVRTTIETRLPALTPMLEHPDFAAEYEREISSAPPEWLASPEYVSGVAAVVLSRLDPARMPAPRDTQGRFSSREGVAAQRDMEAQLRNQAARQSLAQTPPARGGGVARSAPDPQADLGARIFQHIGRQLTPAQARGWESSPDAWNRAAINDYDTWLKETERAEAANGRGGRRR